MKGLNIKPENSDLFHADTGEPPKEDKEICEMISILETCFQGCLRGSVS